MAENKKPNLVYVAVLAVAGGGLMFDKFVLRADAGVGEAIPIAAETAQPEQNASKSPAIEREPLAGRFNEAEGQLLIPALRRLDGFSEPVDDIEIGTQKVTEPTAGGGFASRHRLTSVLSQEGGDIAVVDGLLIKVGETIDGVKLIKVEKDGAIFQSGEIEIRLPLARPGLDR